MKKLLARLHQSVSFATPSNLFLHKLPFNTFIKICLRFLVIFKSIYNIYPEQYLLVQSGSKYILSYINIQW